MDPKFSKKLAKPTIYLKSRNKSIGNPQHLYTVQPKKQKMILIKLPILELDPYKSAKNAENESEKIMKNAINVKPNLAKHQSRNHSLDYASNASFTAFSIENRKNSNSIYCPYTEQKSSKTFINPNHNKRNSYSINPSEYSQNSNKLFQTFTKGSTVYVKRRLSSQHHNKRSRQPLQGNSRKLSIFSTTGNNFTSEITDQEFAQKCFEDGRSALKRKDYQTAIDLFEKSAKKDPNKFAESMLFKGITLMDYGKLKEAIETLKKCLLKKSNKIKSAYLLLAMAYRKNNELEKAFEILNECLKIYPEYVEALISRANLLLAKHQFMQAKRDFEEIIKIDRNINSAYFGLADCEYFLKDYKNSAENYNKGVKLSNIIPLKGILYFY